MDFDQLSVILAFASTAIAVLAPVITAAINARAERKVMMAEMRVPGAQAALDALVDAYWQLVRLDDVTFRFPGNADYISAQFRKFQTAAYRAATFVPRNKQRDKISDFVASGFSPEKTSNDQTDARFFAIVADLAVSIGLHRKRA